MRSETNNTIISPVGIILALGLLVGCNRARLEPQPPPIAGQTQPTVQSQNNGQNPGTPQVHQPPQLQTHSPRTRAPEAVSAAPSICKANTVKANNVVKVLFVVDGSGSNFGAAGSVATDPDKKWRTQTLRKFFTNHVEQKNFHFGMTLFKGTTSKSLINIQGEPVFSNDREVVSEGFRSFLAINDGGNTPYRAALKMAKNIIAADLQDNNSEQGTYAVIMISDGRATDYKNVNDVIPDASAIKDLAPDRITINSVYYSTQKLNASVPQYLKSIAKIGDGAFVVANSNESLNLDNVVRFSSASCL